MSLNDLLPDPDRPSGHTWSFVLWPRQWTANNLLDSLNLDSLNWEIHPFQSEKINEIPRDPGIYSFVVQPGIANYPYCSYLMYVGMTKRPLNVRFKEYFREKRNATTGRPKLLKMLNVYEDYLHFCCSAIEEIGRIEAIEKALLNAFIPPCNDQYPAEISRVMRAFP